MFAILIIAMLIIAGCSSEKPATDKKTSETGAVKKVADHSGWWCIEHAIPEEVCSMCSGKYAKECKDKGDWCEEHDRAKSQCFKCDPSSAEKYAKLYEAKYGQQSPAPIE